MEQWLLLSWGVDRRAVLLRHSYFQVLLPEEGAGGHRGYLQVSLFTHKITNIEQLIGTCDVLYIDVRCGGGVIAGQCRNGMHVIAIYIAFCGATDRVEPRQLHFGSS